MSTTVSMPVACPVCRVEAPALLVESANVQRRPAFRQEVLSGRFMRFDCGHCGSDYVVERDLLYTDFEDRLFAGVFPRQRAEDAEELEAQIAEIYRRTFIEETPGAVRAAIGDLRCRVLFGYEQLRDKVVCFRAGLDDRIVEAIKRAILRASPSPDVSGYSLQRVDPDGSLWLAAIGPNENGAGATEPAPALLQVPAEVYRDLASEVSSLVADVASEL